MRFTFQSTLARSSQYRPDIDGLRAVAVLSVLFFHAKVRGVPGGFVGVDVFFVISGYLITSIIAKDISSERFSFISFYERRVRRIFPALFFLLFGCTFIAAIVFAPEDFLAFAAALAHSSLALAPGSSFMPVNKLPPHGRTPFYPFRRSSSSVSFRTLSIFGIGR
jgi:peptidoglycan/LPS O-acetylase OafA/YrhL